METIIICCIVCGFIINCCFGIIICMNVVNTSYDNWAGPLISIMFFGYINILLYQVHPILSGVMKVIQ